MKHQLCRLKKLTSSILVIVGNNYSKAAIPVLLYHSVDNSGSVISIKPTEFYEQMKYLKYAGYRTASLTEFVQSLNRDVNSISKTVVITFDDGFKNNYSEAFPILRKYGFTATIFLATNYIGGVCSWDKHKSIPDIPLLSWQEIKQMSDYGIDFGAHSCSHCYLTRLSKDKLKAELLNSKSIIEEKLGKPIRFFSHPYMNFSHKTMQAAKECGFLGTFGGLDFGLNNINNKLYSLTRVGTAHFCSIYDFRAGLLGSYDYYIKLKSTIFKAIYQCKRNKRGWKEVKE